MKRVFTKTLPPNIFRYVWYVSILTFLLFFFFHNTINQVLAASPALFILILISIPIGAISYLIYLGGSKRKLKPLIELIVAIILVVMGPLTVVNVRGSKIVHDGTRTGPRVSYQSYCDPAGGYVIYENEKLEFTKEDGEVVYWTKDDIECYKDRQSGYLSKEIPLTPTKTPITYPTLHSTPTIRPLPSLNGDVVLSLVNNYRQQNGIHPLSVSSELCSIADQRAAFMMENNMAAFKDSEANEHTDFKSVSNNYSGSGIGENLAANVTTEQGAINLWIDSPLHNELMLTTNRDGVLVTKACAKTRVSTVGSVVVFLIGDK